MPSADFCPAVRPPLGCLSRRSDTEQISWGKLSRLPCTVAESTLRTLDGYGLRGKWPARPALAPFIRFLSIDSHVCLVLPSDPPCGGSPCTITSPSPPSGWAVDFHLRAAEHAQHTTKSLRDSPLPRGLTRAHGDLREPAESISTIFSDVGCPCSSIQDGTCRRGFREPTFRRR